MSRNEAQHAPAAPRPVTGCPGQGRNLALELASPRLEQGGDGERFWGAVQEGLHHSGKQTPRPAAISLRHLVPAAAR